MLFRSYVARTGKFFRLGQSHETLPNYYTLNFNLVKHHGFSLTELEDMLPFERDIYVVLLRQWLEQQEEIAKRQAQQSQR